MGCQTLRGASEILFPELPDREGVEGIISGQCSRIRERGLRLKNMEYGIWNMEYGDLVSNKNSNRC